MLAELLHAIAQANSPRFDHPFVNQARQGFKTNVAGTTLWVRWNWQAIPIEVVAAAQQMNAIASQQAQTTTEQRQINDQVNAQMGALGFSPRSTNFGYSAGPTVAPEEILLLGTLATIRQYSGDPPAQADLVNAAEQILQGRRDPHDALVLGAPLPLREQARLVARFASLSPMLKLVALINAALAVPRSRIPGLLGFSSGASHSSSTHEQAFEVAMAATKVLAEKGDWQSAQPHVLAALRAAEQTPDTADDIESVQYAILGAARFRVDPEVLRVALRIVTSLIRNRQRLPEATASLAQLSMLIDSYGLSAELDAAVLSAIGVALGSDIPDGKLALGLKASVIWLRQGDSARAAALLDDVARYRHTAQDELEFAMARADVAWANLDREGAASELANAIRKFEKAPDNAVMIAIQKLVSLWPDETPALEEWIAKLDERIGRLDEPERTLNRLTIMVAWLRSGKRDAVGNLAQHVDFAKLRQNLPPPLHPMVAELEQALAE